MVSLKVWKDWADLSDEAVHEDKVMSDKKRSIFKSRSPGTASSPDLATLVRLAKEARGNNNNTSPRQSHRGVPSQINARSRAVSQASVALSDWDGPAGDSRSVTSGVSSGDRMTTISEVSRSNKTPEDGFKVSLLSERSNPDFVECTQQGQGHVWQNVQFGI